MDIHGTCKEHSVIKGLDRFRAALSAAQDAISTKSRMSRGVFRLMCTFIVFAALLALPKLASAQQGPTSPLAPAPDKSGFTIFDPTPTADLRSFCTDRPTKSTAPCTVDAGHLQFESDLFNVTVDSSGGATTTTWLLTNPTAKLGLTNTLEAEINMVPWETVLVRDRATGQTSRASGVGDLYARLKWNLLGDDGGNIAFALSPYVKAPTASLSIGNGAVEAGLIAPINFNLPMNFSLVVDPELDLLKNANNGSRHVNTSGLLSLSRPVSQTVTVSAEIWTDVNFDPGGRTTQVSVDLGAAWIPSSQPNLQLDGGVNLGLNSCTPGVQAYVGISRRF